MGTYTSIEIDGESATCLPADDRGLHFGDGVFTTALIWSGVVIMPDRHVDRLHADALRLGMTPPATSTLHSDFQAASQRQTAGVVKYILSRGSAGRGYVADPDCEPRRIVLTASLPLRPQRLWKEGIVLAAADNPVATPQVLAGAKHLNRLEQVLARTSMGTGVDEVLLCTIAGTLVGGSMTNLFFVQDGILHTPAISEAGVSGTMRAQILETAKTMGLSAIVDHPVAADLEGADEAFVTNALIGVWPVRRFRNRDWRPGELTRALAHACGHPLAGQVPA